MASATWTLNEGMVALMERGELPQGAGWGTSGTGRSMAQGPEYDGHNEGELSGEGRLHAPEGGPAFLDTRPREVRYPILARNFTMVKEGDVGGTLDPSVEVINKAINRGERRNTETRHDGREKANTGRIQEGLAIPLVTLPTRTMNIRKRTKVKPNKDGRVILS